jgi:hypothetical protein
MSVSPAGAAARCRGGAADAAPPQQWRARAPRRSAPRAGPRAAAPQQHPPRAPWQQRRPRPRGAVRCAAEPHGAPPGGAPRSAPGPGDSPGGAAAPGAGSAAASAGAGSGAGAPGWAWATALSRRVNLDLALAEAAGAALQGCGEAEPSVVFVFASSGYGQALDLLVPMLRRLLPTARAIVGCTGFGVAGARADGGGPHDEVEHAPAVALALGSLPSVTLSLRHVQGLPDGGGAVRAQAGARARRRGEGAWGPRCARTARSPVASPARADAASRHRLLTPAPTDAPPAEWARLTGLPLATGPARGSAGSAGSGGDGSSGEGGGDGAGAPAAGGGGASPAAAAEQTNFIVVADPAYAEIEELLGGLDFAYPEAQKIGANGSPGPGGTAAHAARNRDQPAEL